MRRLDDTWCEQRHTFVHEWSAHLAEQCIEHDVGEVVIGDPSGIRVDETTNGATNWGAHGNVGLHSWPFDKAANALEYKLRRRGIEVTHESERDTSKTCACSGRKRTANRVERGLYACDDCHTVAHGDVGGAENIRCGVGAAADARCEEPTARTSESGETAAPRRGKLNARRQDGVEDRITGWLAQPAVYLYDLSNGFAPRDHVVACKP